MYADKHPEAPAAAQQPALNLIDGVPSPHSEHPRVALAERGSWMAVADGATVAAYRLAISEGRAHATHAWEHCLGQTVCELLALRGAAFLALVECEHETVAWVLDASAAPRPLVQLPGGLIAAIVAGGRLVVATRGMRVGGATLYEVDLASGQVGSDQRLPSPHIDLVASPSGARWALVDKRQRRVEFRAAAGTTPCPDSGSRDPARPAQDARPGCDCIPRCTDPCTSPQGYPSRMPPSGDSTKSPPREPAQPSGPCAIGDAGVPDDHGGGIVSDGDRVHHRPPPTLPGTRDDDPLGEDCWGTLFWTPDRLRWAGRYVVAMQGNFMLRMAVLASGNLSVVRERHFGRQGALVFTGSDSDALVVFHPKQRKFEWLDPIASVFDPLDKDVIVALAPREKVFVGQQTLSLSAEAVPSMGDVNVLVLPVVEPGQAFNEPNLVKVWNFLDGGYFATTRHFYEENSFKQVRLHFHMFGHNRGPAGGPLLLPEPVAKYFWPPFFAGGVALTRPLPAAPGTVLFKGGEKLTLRVTPRADSRQPLDLTLHLAAALLRAEHDAFPVKLVLGAGATANVAVRDTSGATHALALTVAPQMITIDKANPQPGLAQVEAAINQALAAAEVTAGVASRPIFAPCKARRVQKTGLEFGELHVSLSFAPRPAGLLRPAVTSISGSASLSGLGFSDTVRGEFRLPADASRLQDYVTRVMRQAEADNAATAVIQVLADAAAVDTSAGLKVTLLLSDNDGGPKASIAVTASNDAGELFTATNPLQGSDTTRNYANAPKDIDKLFNDAFTAAAARMGGDLSPVNNIHAVMVGFIGAAPGVWNAAATVGTANLREAQKTFTAEDGANKARQLKARWLLSFLNGSPATATLCHELGHAFGYRDLYFQTDYRDDLRYLETWAAMDDQGNFPHHCGYHKSQTQWIPEGRIAEVPKPDPGVKVKEALLVPVEFWDDGMVAAVRTAYPGVDATQVPVSQLMRMNLGGDGGMTDYVEARQATSNFSLNLPHSPALLVTNAVLYWDTREYAKVVGDEKRYRRECHLLNEGHELRNPGDEFDLGLPDELPAPGIKVRILDRKTVPRPAGNVEVFHVRVTREESPAIDLGFTQLDPYWKNPDLWLDHADPGQTSPHIWPEGEPLHQGDKIHVPPADRPDGQPEPHWVVARVRNYGVVAAEKVRVDFAICRPPGQGDRGNFQRFESVIVSRLEAGEVRPVVATWNVDANEKGHTCLRATIADYKIPEDAGTGIALGSEDVKLANSEAIKNLDQHEALSASPYEPVTFEFSVNNERPTAQRAYLQPERLPMGMRLAVSPPEQSIAPNSTAIFKCRLELDSEVIDTGCRSDSEFTILAWRMTAETSVRWGGVTYRIRPRKKTTTTLSGGWMGASAGLNGRVDPDPGGGEVRLRINFDNVPARWQAVPLNAGGTFQLDLMPPAGAKELDAEAVYRGSRDLSSSQSAPVRVFPYVVK